jgi:hypothetical protein
MGQTALLHGAPLRLRDAAGGEAVAQAAILRSLGQQASAARVLDAPRPTRSYVSTTGAPCIGYTQRVRIDGKPVNAAANVCKTEGGGWALDPSTAVASEAERQGFHCPKPGTVIETSLGGRLRFLEQDGFRCWYRDENGAESSRFAMLLGGDSPWLGKGGEQIRDLWPLAVGKRRWFIVDGVSSGGFPTSWYETYTVAGKERVTVPAGTFDAYVIDWQEQGREGNGYTAMHRFWYAPSLGYAVRFEADKAPGTTLADWQATRIAAPPNGVMASLPRENKRARKRNR